MKRILKKRILPLLCAGLLLCTPHPIAYAAAGGMAEESTAAQIEETAPPVEKTAPPMEETAPPSEENTEPPSYSVEIAWESLEFDYAPLWNPDEHCYDGWESTETPIMVTNTTENGVPIRVTLTFVPTGDTGAAVVFSPCEDDPNPDDFTFSDGQVTFLLPRNADGEAQATVNLSLTSEPMSWEIGQYNQIGAIKTEIMPLDEEVQDLEVVPPPGVSDIPLPPATDLPLPETEPPIVEEPAEKPTEPSQPAPTEPSQPGTLPTEPSQPETLPTQPSQPESGTEPEQPPPSEEEQTPPETEAEKPKQESTPDVPPLPEHDAKEESKAAPSPESGAPPQEEPQ